MGSGPYLRTPIKAKLCMPFLLMCTAAPKKAPHPQMSTHFTMWCNPKAFKLSSTTLFSGLAGGYCAISSDQRQDGDRLAEPQNAVCDATSALSTRGEILSKGCSCQTAEMELRTTANILQSLARKISILPFFNKILPKLFQYSYQIGFIHIEKISTIFSI